MGHCGFGVPPGAIAVCTPKGTTGPQLHSRCVYELRQPVLT